MQFRVYPSSQEPSDDHCRWKNKSDLQQLFGLDKALKPACSFALRLVLGNWILERHRG
jgi:hypothetical protein